jgi:hypothetical protein
MGTSELHKQRKTHLKNLLTYLLYINKLPASKKIQHFQKISKKRLDYISEIILNFLNSNIKTDNSIINKLQPLREILHKIASKKTSLVLKKHIISSLKGIYILHTLLPLTIKIISNL